MPSPPSRMKSLALSFLSHGGVVSQKFGEKPKELRQKRAAGQNWRATGGVHKALQGFGTLRKHGCCIGKKGAGCHEPAKGANQDKCGEPPNSLHAADGGIRQPSVKGI